MSITVFAGGQVGQWRVEGIEPVTGPPLPTVSRLAISDRTHLGDSGVAWALRGRTSNTRYTHRDEQEALAVPGQDVGDGGSA